MDKPLIAVLGLSSPPEPHGFNLGHFPLIRIQPVAPLPQIPLADWAFWTSKQAIGLLAPILSKQNSLRHAVLGLAEASALNGFNMNPQWISPEATGLASARAFVTSLTTPQVIWWPCGQQANPAIAKVLQSLGHTLLQTVVYETITIICPKPELPIKAWLFTSPSTVKAFIENQWTLLPGQTVGALGPTTATTIKQLLGITPCVAEPSGNWVNILTKLS